MIVKIEKPKKFVESHRTELIVGGILIAVGAVCKAANIYHRNRCDYWGLQGLVMGFHGAIDWFDEEFTNLNLRRLYDEWAKAHPEEILYV